MAVLGNRGPVQEGHTKAAHCQHAMILREPTVFNTGRSRRRPRTGNRLRNPSTTGKKPLNSNQNPYVSTQIPTKAHLTRISITPTRKQADPCRQTGTAITRFTQNCLHDIVSLATRKSAIPAHLLTDLTLQGQNPYAITQHVDTKQAKCTQTYVGMKQSTSYTLLAISHHKCDRRSECIKRCKLSARQECI